MQPALPSPPHKPQWAASARKVPPSTLASPRARGTPSLPRLHRPPAAAISPPRGTGSLRGEAKMRADLPPGGSGVIGLRYGPIASLPGCDRLLHIRDRLSTAREARLRPFPQCLGENYPVALPTGDELEPRDHLLAAQAERRGELVRTPARGLHRRHALLSLFRPGSRHRHSVSATFGSACTAIARIERAVGLEPRHMPEVHPPSSHPALELAQRHLPDPQHAGRAAVSAGQAPQVAAAYFFKKRA